MLSWCWSEIKLRLCCKSKNIDREGVGFEEYCMVYFFVNLCICDLVREGGSVFIEFYVLNSRNGI